MMHFINAAADTPLLAELRESGVLAPDVIERIDAAMGRPETGTLSDFLLAGAETVSENAWLTWLIRRHGCHRFGRVGWHPEIIAAADSEFAGDNLPYRACADGSLLVAVLRPETFADDARRLAPRQLHRAAATLRELRDLRAAWRKAHD